MAMTAKNHCALKPAQREPETTFMVRDTKETKPKDEAIPPNISSLHISPR